MEKFDITGMSCAACSARVEKAAKSVKGVASCSVNLLTNTLLVDGKFNSEEVIAAVEKAGYGATKSGDPQGKNQESDALKDKTTPKLLARLISSIVVLLALMYFAMFHKMWGAPIPALVDNPISIGVVQLILAFVVILINNRFFKNGFKGLLHRAPNMDTLVALGSGVSFVYSTSILFIVIDKIVKGDVIAAQTYASEYYFESAAMILTLITVGKTLESFSKGKTTNALKGLMALKPQVARILCESGEKLVSIDAVCEGDKFVVKAGDFVPVDGIIIEGEAAFDESSLTGESIPIDKKIGDKVSDGTINKSGYVVCRATRVGKDTTLSQIIKMVSDAQATKAPIAQIADKVSGVFVPVVMSLSLITLIVWLCVGSSVGFAISRAITVLVISCPCALGLATPVAIMVASGKGARNGILFKTAQSLENLGKAQIVVLDKTGTITKGEPSVTDVVCVDGCSRQELISIAFSLERLSEHPLSKAVGKMAESEQSGALEVKDFEVVAGNGLKAKLSDGGKSIYGGNLEFIQKFASVTIQQKQQISTLAKCGKTPLLFAIDERLLGIIAVADTIKDDSIQAVKDMQNMGIKVVMLTGDNQYTADAIGAQIGVDFVVSGVKPDGKENVIQQLKKQGRVVMVGDGINDAPALTCADVGVAIGSGTDVAIDSADVVLVNSKLGDVVCAIRLSRRALLGIYENLFWAFIYNIIGIPLAAGLFTSWFGWELPPMFGAAAMSLSSFCVVVNALRLNIINLHSSKLDWKIKKEIIISKENLIMKKTIKVQGMMCNHCVSTVKKALLAVDGVEQVDVSLQEQTAVVTLSKDVSNNTLKTAVVEQDFEVLSIE